MESANTSVSEQFLNDQLINEDSIGLSGNCNADLLFHQLPLPDQLLQSDEKDGEDDSSNSSMNGIHRRELDRSNIDLTGLAAYDQEQQDQSKVNLHSWNVSRIKLWFRNLTTKPNPNKN